MSRLLGRVVLCSQYPGLTGTIVHSNTVANAARPYSLLSKDPTWDVLWSDGTCTRSVAEAVMTQPDWSLQEQKIPETECNRLWFEFQIKRANSRSNGAQTSLAAVAAPIVINRQQRMNPDQSARRVFTQDDMEQILRAPVPQGRTLSASARDILARVVPGHSFAVNCDRKTLNIGWMDGPVDEVVYRNLTALKGNGSADKITTKRGITEAFVQAGINYVMNRVFGDDVSSPEAMKAGQRLTPTEYSGGGLTGFLPPVASAVGSTPYKDLIRCVIDRWDDASKSFVDVRRTHFLVIEQRALFPLGDGPAAIEFAELISGVRERNEVARGALDSLRVRERG
jgi:hypothetical protein